MDVHYAGAGAGARAAGVVFADWTAATPADSIVADLDGAEPYVSGQFYRRELPCLRPLVAAATKRFSLTALVVDGFVDLAADAPGLGRHLFEAFGQRWPVVGVAKNEFIGAPARAVLRGTSKRPLWVTSTDAADKAAANVRSMAGEHRIPDLLKLVDSVARGHVAGCGDP